MLLRMDNAEKRYAGRRFSVADGLTLYYRDYPCADGAKPCILCLPGLTRNSSDFDDLAVHLNDRYRVLCADFRGRGSSDHDTNWRRYQPQTYVGDVIDLLDHAAVQTAIVIGTSLGGVVAMLLALSDRRRVAGIVLNDIGPEIAAEGRARIALYAGQLPAVHNWHDAAEQARHVYGATLPDFNAADWQRYARRIYRATPNAGLVLNMDPAIGRALRESVEPAPDPWPLYAALGDLPMLALRGALSDILSPATFERMAHDKPDLARATIPNRGHVPLLDEPESLRAIDSFLGTLRSV